MGAAHKLPPLSGATVLLRGDFRAGVPQNLADAVALLAREGARVAIVAALGEPRSEFDPTLSLSQFRGTLQNMSGVPVTFVHGSVGPLAEARLAQTPFGAAALLENIRFHPLAHRDSRAFALRLSCLADYYADCGAAPDKPLAWHGAIETLLPAPPVSLPETCKGH